MIQAKKLTKAFDGFPALRGLDLTVEQGSVYGLIGRNGTGKTTLELRQNYSRTLKVLKKLGYDKYIPSI